MTSLSSTELNAIHDLLFDCGQYALQQSKQSFQVFEKGIDDFVTTVDTTLDQKLLCGFKNLFPEDGIITEENIETLRQFKQNYHRLWFIDPIDGTDDFIHGRPDYAVMVGQVIHGIPTAGWVYAPAYRQLVWGSQEWGLCQWSAHNGRTSLSAVEPPCRPEQPWSMVIGDKDWRRYGASLKDHLPEVQFISMGSFGLKVLTVIRGEAGLYGYFNGRVKLWDTTGPLALAQAAGLICCDLAGNPIRFEPPFVEPETLVHQQPIVVGWPSYIKQFLPQIRQSIISQDIALNTSES
jgi:3'(2'), 5'-bisphosphate nucleotidase